MTERPIIFSAPMTRALLAGTKTQTRRVVKPLGAVHIVPFIGADDRPTGEFGWCPNERVITEHIRCPYGAPGDRLWVRETHMDLGACYLYRADDGAEHERAIAAPGQPWRPAIHMPRALSRITLEITGVRVERLQDISEADALAEGPAQHPDGPWHAYRSLWTLINGRSSWDADPWVWVVEFRRVTP